MKKQIVNFIFFLRVEEPREPDWDLFATFKNQAEAIDSYGFPVTYLLEYDVLINEDYRKILLKEKAKRGQECEIGGWFEVVRQLVEKAGLVWRGREGQNWDWRCNVGFSEGYTPKEREKLVDTYFEDFKKHFGCYPKSVGSWMMDAHTLGYMYDRYGIVASCNCRDQIGTDGYTLWGGYFGQGYYPSRNNAFCPANSKENQISVPVFRMLGTDPMYHIDSNMEIDASVRPKTAMRDCLTLEPAYQAKGGGNRKWVDWFLKENFRPEALSFNYVQAGQENAFDWSVQEKGLLYQLECFDRMRKENGLSFQTLSETGEWYRSRYPVTPASSMVTLSDWDGGDRKSFWYYSRYYRFNALIEEDKLIIRDTYLFDNSVCERYLSDTCKTRDMYYDNLPFIDGNRWSGGKVRSCAELCLGFQKEIVPIDVAFVSVEYPDENSMILKIELKDLTYITVTLYEDKIEFLHSGGKSLALRLTAAEAKSSVTALGENSVQMNYNGHDYSVSVEGGYVIAGDSIHPWIIYSNSNYFNLHLIDYRAKEKCLKELDC